MKKLTPKLDRYYKRCPAEFSVVESMTLSQKVNSVGVMTYNLQVLLSSNTRIGKLSLEFFDVSNFIFRQPSYNQITCWLEILDGTDLPMVHGRYLVRDPEQDFVLRFECRDFELG